MSAASIASMSLRRTSGRFGFSTALTSFISSPMRASVAPPAPSVRRISQRSQHSPLREAAPVVLEALDVREQLRELVVGQRQAL